METRNKALPFRCRLNLARFTYYLGTETCTLAPEAPEYAGRTRTAPRREEREEPYAMALAMPKAAAAARPPISTAWSALRVGPVPVNWPLM